MAVRRDNQRVSGCGDSPKRVIAAAYNYAESGGDLPREIELGQYLETYGAQAVTGRVLGAGELRRITVAKNIVAAYRSREGYRDESGAENWAEWSRTHPEQARILNMAAITAEELDNGS